MTVAQLEEVLSFLHDNGYNAHIDKTKIIIAFEIERRIFHLKCVFPIGFPYVFPQMYLLEEEYNEIAPLPHVNNDFSICTYDSNVCIPNFKNHLALTKEVIDEAIKIISEGVRGENEFDFIDEFNAYWRLEACEFIESIFTPTGKPKRLFCYYHEANKMNYVSDDRESLTNYLNNLGITVIYDKNFKKCLYLPLNSVMKPPFPETNLEILLYVKQNSLFYNEYKKFLQQNIGHPVIIVFSQNVSDSLNLQAWMHTLLGDSLISKHSKAKLPGFRNDKINPAVIFQGREGKEKIYRLSVQNMNLERLFPRGGEGWSSQIESASIIGCGSVGSLLAETLTVMGTRRLMLIDKEKLSDENIARHLCGYEYINKPKSDSIKSKLTRHNPNLVCNSFHTNIFDFMERNLSSVNKYDYIFVAVGSTPIEHLIIEHFLNGEILKPLVLIWVEPFMLGGHAIVLQKKQDVYQVLFDENYTFTKPIVKAPEKYLKREAGCQSTYIPYSGFEVRCFLNKVIEYLCNDIIAKGKRGNYLLSYIGRISSAAIYDACINDEWVVNHDNSLVIKRFD